MKYSKLLFAAGVISALTLGAMPVFAQPVTATTGSTPSTTSAREMRGDNARAAADKQIAARISSLNNLETKIQAMVHLTADEKSAITATISGNISSLTALQSKIDTDATTTLKTDTQSITKGERIYMLVEPQIAILAATDRAASISDMLTAFAAKIETRLASTPNATVSSLLSDLQAKVADAQSQTQAAISETASLQPDNGVAPVQASNTATLKDARSKIKTAQNDLKKAYQDASQIVKALRGTRKTASSTPE